MGEGGGGEEKGSFSLSALSLLRFHLFSFPPETPVTQAIFFLSNCTYLWYCFGGRILTQFPVQVCYSQ